MVEAVGGGRAVIVAVGGAKGGIGKSVFATNLGVVLASHGLRTMVVDLDLGGANQHLYLGHRSILSRTINDFLAGRVGRLDEIAFQTAYGPWLLGGNSSELGAANLPFAQKMKLLRAIRALEADYVILDLGGDTAYNILDCFNVADHGIVVTTRESAAYVGAYQFIKHCLYRRLSRLFKPESRFADRKDEALAEILDEATTPQEASGRTIEELVALVGARAPESVSLLEEALADFNPLLVVNRVTPEVDVAKLVATLQSVMRRWLGREVSLLGVLSERPEVVQSVIDLVPVAIGHPQGESARELEEVAARLQALPRPGTWP